MNFNSLRKMQTLALTSMIFALSFYIFSIKVERAGWQHTRVIYQVANGFILIAGIINLVYFLGEK